MPGMFNTGEKSGEKKKAKKSEPIFGVRHRPGAKALSERKAARGKKKRGGGITPCKVVD